MIDRIARRLSRPIIQLQRYQRDRDNVNLVLSEALSGKEIAFPTRYLEFLRQCIEPKSLTLTELKSSTLDKWSAITTALRSLPPVPFCMAEKIAMEADKLSRNTAKYSDLWGDFRQIAELSSSDGLKGRILATVSRFAQSESILEMGTCLGLGTMFLAETRPQAGVVTIEAYEGHHRIASDVLKPYGDRVTCELGYTTEVCRKLSVSFDVVFHDADHSHDAYVNDFAAMLPLLSTPAVVLIDDIRWEHIAPGFPKTRTYEGWQAIANDTRVTAALEIDGMMGLVLVS